jgi:hypothetical protein
LSVAWFAETLVGVAIVIVSGWAVGADSSDSYVLGLADTLLGNVAEEFIQTLAGNHTASLSVLVVGLPSQAPRAGSLHDVETWGAVAFATVEVVDLVASALHSANSLVDVVDLSLWALGAEVVDEEKSRFADTSSSNEVLVGTADGRAHSIASLS